MLNFYLLNHNNTLSKGGILSNKQSGTKGHLFGLREVGLLEHEGMAELEYLS